MSYRCSICGAVAPRGQDRLTHVIERVAPARPYDSSTRPRREIAAELPVCAACKSALEGGTPLAELYRTRAPRAAAPAPAVIRAFTPPPLLPPAPAPPPRLVGRVVVTPRGAGNARPKL